MNKFFLYLLIIILFLLVLQLGFFSQTLFSLINFVLILILYLLIDRYKYSYWWLVILAATVLDTFTTFRFVTLIIFLLVVWFIYMISKTWLTNRSLYTILFLGILGSIIYKILLIVMTAFFGFVINWSEIMTQISIAIFIESIFMAIVYIISQNFNKNIYHG